MRHDLFVDIDELVSRDRLDTNDRGVRVREFGLILGTGAWLVRGGVDREMTLIDGRWRVGFGTRVGGGRRSRTDLGSRLDFGDEFVRAALGTSGILGHRCVLDGTRLRGPIGFGMPTACVRLAHRTVDRRRVAFRVVNAIRVGGVGSGISGRLGSGCRRGLVSARHSRCDVTRLVSFSRLGGVAGIGCRPADWGFTRLSDRAEGLLDVGLIT